MQEEQTRRLIYGTCHNKVSDEHPLPFTLHLFCMINDIVEAHCYVVISSELTLMSKYVAESIKQLIAGHLGHVGLSQLCTKLKMLQCEMSYTV